MSILLIVGLVAIGLWMMSAYNGLVTKMSNVENAEKQIDIQIDVRFKLFENLAKIVSKAMDYESSTLANIVKLRSKWDSAATTEEKQAVEREMQQTGGINVVMEAYPDLTANENALELQRSVESAERKLGFAKQAYNDSITTYNISKRSFPLNLIVGIFSGVNRDFTMWELSKEDAKAKEEKSIEF
jgi:LemA protein